MRVVGIAGSLRAKSNTLQYVNTALNVLDRNALETELISLRGKEIKPCNGCYDCVKNGITVPGSTYWNVGMAGAGGARDAENDEEGLATVTNFASNMAAVMNKIYS
jgi:multimeric flavodoxin WrbA